MQRTCNLQLFSFTLMALIKLKNYRTMTHQFNSKKEFERKHPYVIVTFSEFENQQPFATIVKSFTNKKTAENWIEREGQYHNSDLEVMTRKKYCHEDVIAM